jgi:hypothetical protein
MTLLERVIAAEARGQFSNSQEGASVVGISFQTTDEDTTD